MGVYAMWQPYLRTNERNASLKNKQYKINYRFNDTV